MKKYDVFISYRRKSASGAIDGTYVARMLKMELEQRGYTVFFDYNECTDGDFVDRILPSIRNSKYFILVLTPGALIRCSEEHDWVRREIHEALAADCKIVPISPDQGFKDWPEDFPEELNQLKTIQISDISTGTLFEKSTDLMVEKRLAPPHHFNYKRFANTAIIILLVAVCYFAATGTTDLRREKLLFLGSGTVDSYLNRRGVNVCDYPNGLYAALPASSAFRVIEEERTIGPYTKKQRNRSYFPIVFSARDAADSDFVSSGPDRDYFMNEIGRICRVFLSNDSLQLLLYPKSAFNLDNDTCINGKQLVELLRAESGRTNIFRTTSGSGTYRAYSNLLAHDGLNLDDISSQLFVRKTTTLREYGNRFIVLGSSAYQGAVEEPGFAESMQNSAVLLKVHDDEGGAIYKPLYIYFVAYIVDGMRNEVMIPRPVMKFLSRIGHKPHTNTFGATAELMLDIKQ